MSRGCLSRGCLSGRPPPPVTRMTDRCKNITLPQTSFAGGKYMDKSVFNASLHRYGQSCGNIIV